jgi:hypothetical protein
MIVQRFRDAGHTAGCRHVGHPDIGLWVFCVDDEIVATAQSRTAFVDAVRHWLMDEGYRMLAEPEG